MQLRTFQHTTFVIFVKTIIIEKLSKLIKSRTKMCMLNKMVFTCLGMAASIQLTQPGDHIKQPKKTRIRGSPT